MYFLGYQVPINKAVNDISIPLLDYPHNSSDIFNQSKLFKKRKFYTNVLEIMLKHLA